MKILIVDTYYPEYQINLYRDTDIAGLPYAEQRKRLLDTCFGTSDFYSRHLKKMGIDAEEIIANCAPLQLQWAREHKLGLVRFIPPEWTRSSLAAKVIDKAGVLLPIVVEQIERSRPDVLYLQDLNFIPSESLRGLKSVVKLIVGQIASPLPPKAILEPYDVILTSFPHFVPRIREMGVGSEYFRLGFEPGVIDRVGIQEKKYPCTFVGGITPEHTKSRAFLEHVAPYVDFFGYGADRLPPDSPVLRRHHGERWALDMYRTLAQSQITLNRHVDVAENFANNMRLYEATGMGALLLTDAKSNLHELFEIGKEVVAYESNEQAVELIQYYSEHAAERDAIASAGQKRTHREHSYQRRMEELGPILMRYL